MLIPDNYIFPNIDIIEPVAIIGSSGNLLNNQYGEEIDYYNTVVRFNRAPIDGYERYVGSKTTIRVANNHVFVGTPVTDPRYTNQPADFIKNQKNTNILFIGPHMITYEQGIPFIDKSSKLYIFNYKSIGAVKLNANFNTPNNPTVGLVFVCLCITLGIIPTVYGFDSTKDVSRTHYWEGRGPAGPCHDISYEKLYLEEMNNIGEITLK